MLGEINFIFILLAAFIAVASPGPATLAIAGTSMRAGRRAGLAVSSGVMTGSLFWSVSAAFGLAAIMSTNAWVLDAVRYLGTAYLMYLAFKSGRSAIAQKELQIAPIAGSMKVLYLKGAALHLTNPKAVLFFTALYSLGTPTTATVCELVLVILAVAIQSCMIFFGYALLFSTEKMTRVYVRLRRLFEALFALGFGFAGIRILTARLS